MITKIWVVGNEMRTQIQPLLPRVKVPWPDEQKNNAVTKCETRPSFSKTM